MIDAGGLITAAEAAKRLRLSTGQVRRRLRQGKLKGRRIGNQWFVEERDLSALKSGAHLVPPQLLRRIDETRERIFRRTGSVFDAVAIIREVREKDFGEQEDGD